MMHFCPVEAASCRHPAKLFRQCLTIVAGIGLLLLPRPGFALDPSKTVYQYNSRTWGRQTGFPANGVRAIAQTKDGYIWLGTQNGLIRFDGIDFTTVELPRDRQFRTQVISGISPAPQGGFWFAINNAGFGFYEGTHFSSFTNLPWVTADMDVWTIRETADAALWLGTSRGAVRWRKGEDAVMYTNELPQLLAICDDRRGRVWLGTVERGISYWEAGKLHAFTNDLKSQLVFAMTVDQQDRLWVGTEMGVRCYELHDSEFRPVETLSALASTEVKVLLTDRSGTVWIGTTGEGLIRYQEGVASSLRQTNGLASDFILSLMEDREGNIWVGTREGLSELTDVKFPIYSQTEGVFGACHSVWASALGGIWAATAQGFSHVGIGTNSHYSLEPGVLSSYVKRVFEASNGDLYLINGGKDILILSGGKIVARYPNSSWPTAFAEDAHGVVVSVADNLFRVSRTNCVPFAFLDGQKPGFYWIRNISGAHDGSLLVASVNGVFRIAPDGKVEHWTVEDGLPDYDVLWVNEFDDGVIWAGLQMGIARIQGRRVRGITRENGLGDSYIYAIVPDNNGNMWMGSSHGILRTSRRSVEDFAAGKTNQIACAVYDGLDAVRTIDTTDVEYSGCRSADGRIWFPSPQGAIMIDPAHIVTNAVPPPVHLEQVRINGIEQLGPAAARPRPGIGQLEIQYSALSYTAPGKIHFRYRLQGYDTDWVDAGSRRSAFYTNLKPRAYTFEVQACNADGVWNTTGASFAAELPPNVFQTVWFRVAAGVAAIALLIAAYGWRTRLLRKREQHLREMNELLEAKVSERTRELAEQHTLLRTLIDHLPDNVYVKDTQSRIVLDNIAHARLLGDESPDSVIGKTDFDFFPRVFAEKFFADEQKVIQSGEAYNGEERTLDNVTGERRWVRTTKVPLRDSKGATIGLAGISRDITEQKLWESKLQELHKQLIETSRQAGMAEVATSVLHNVGNVLNSVNISAQILEEKLKTSAVAKLSKVLALLRENQKDLAHFFTHDERGKQVLDYLDVVAEHLTAEKNGLLQETAQLVHNVDHIKGIVAMQQTYARVAGILEVIKPAEVVEDALRMHAMAFERHVVQVVREFSEEAPTITADRHKIIQILVNLLQNAKYACDKNAPGNRIIKVRIAGKRPERLIIEVADNGVGIPSENLQRIFSHGFTTRKNGHGFGLHSGALAAREMGGSLTAHSDGPGAGARFTLELPVQSVAREGQRALTATVN